jgi:hypothetical protein
MSILSGPYFHDEDAAREQLERIVWPSGPHYPRCGAFDRLITVKGGGPGLRCCNHYAREFIVTVGTIFDRSKVPLNKHFQAAHPLAASKKGFSIHEVHRVLKITFKTAWFMEQRLREAMRELHPTSPIGGEGKTVEFDETHVGGKEKKKHVRKRHSMGGGAGKEIVLSLVARQGAVLSHHIPSVSDKTLRPILAEQIRANTSTVSDEGGARIGEEIPGHQTVNHSIGEYVRGDMHTNTMVGYFSILKRGIVGTYHLVGAQQLKRYLADLDSRYNERMALGMSDEACANKLIRGIVGKRPTYRYSFAG